MNKKFKTVLLLGSLCTMSTLSSNVFAESYSNGASLLTPTEFSVPSGYSLQSKNDGICIYKGVNNVYIQIVDLAGGANVKFGIGKYMGTETFSNKKIDKVYKRNSIDHYLSERQSSDAKLFSVLNAQFFDISENTTFLSFPVKSNGKVFSKGPDLRLDVRPSTDFRTLQIFDQNSSWLGVKRATKTIPYYRDYKYNRLSGKVIVGFSPYTNHETRRYQKIGRTFVAPHGGMFTPANGEYPILMFAFAKAKTQNQMITAMQDWYVSSEDIVMFDGSHSTQYKDVNGLKVTGQYRPVPMVFETYTH